MKPVPTLRQLRYLEAVVERCHFGQAAAACNVSQSTLSAAIQELEDLLGAPLLERTKRSVVPTALGRSVAERARGLLKGAEDLVDLAQAARDPLSGRCISASSRPSARSFCPAPCRACGSVSPSCSSTCARTRRRACSTASTAASWTPSCWPCPMRWAISR